MHSDILIILKRVNRKKGVFCCRRMCRHSSAESNSTKWATFMLPQKKKQKKNSKILFIRTHTHWNRARLGLGWKCTCDLAVWNTRCDKNNVKVVRFVSLVKRHIKIVCFSIVVNDKNIFINVNGNMEMLNKWLLLLCMCHGSWIHWHCAVTPDFSLLAVLRRCCFFWRGNIFAWNWSSQFYYNSEQQTDPEKKTHAQLETRQ